MYGTSFFGLIHQHLFGASTNPGLLQFSHPSTVACTSSGMDDPSFVSSINFNLMRLKKVKWPSLGWSICQPLLTHLIMTSFWEDFKHRSAYLGAALSWFPSFLRDRTQTVVINSQRSKTSLVTSGVLQGSVLGPILFLLYSANIGLIAEKNRSNFHSYADDSELYIHCIARDAAMTCLRVVLCITDIDNWMASNWLKLNSDKTQFIMIGSMQQLAWTVVVFAFVT